EPHPPNYRGKPPAGLGRLELAAAREDALALLDELRFEPLELLLAAPDELELRLDVRKCRLEDAEPLGVRLRHLEALAQRGARLFRLEQLLELVEREVEQVAQPRQLADALDVDVGVQAVRAFLPVAALQQADLLVVANRPRRDARALRELADADHAAASKTVSESAARTCAGRSSDTAAPTCEMPASTQSARCKFEMNGSSCAVERPDVRPEKILKRTSCGTAAVTIAITNAIEITAPVFWSITRAPAAMPRRFPGTEPIIAAVFGLMNMPEPMPTTVSQSALQTYAVCACSIVMPASPVS